ncbi:hypothetical protein NO932_11485 [Pelagibacterium sp. 26DY04]|uniref:hypothetical protein n=1 Tax=Pelagibacterium sp. 26DY04 TaxID=2967130 RepID=UPI002814A6B5|nr:hypothetical protein [Pelagibacterium sp. 26DY04]WMT85549.1 hypothetical protein NO932_11485 [Pelagibacterium sp. 26DY04]
MNEVRCACCNAVVRAWTPYRVQDKLYVCFRHCGVAQQIEARFEMAQPRAKS